MSSVTQVQAAAERPLVDLDTFGRRLGDYARWREELIALIHEYQSWIETQGLSSGEDDLRIYELMDGLRSDKLNIALVAEFSRGKTELINAIFFADYKQRLLPSDAGRTTMCPTELLYDERLPPCVRLLPIETRKGHATITELKRQPIQWTTLPLDLDSPKQMTEALLESVRTKGVPPREAEELGLYNPRATGAGPSLTSDGKIEIPVWRHVVINFPHPLLKQGLVVLDTPGLNSLGTEPELTLNMIPAAHAVLFLLAADTGVTKSDLEVWTNHVCVARTAREGARIAVLNKIDALWDELRGEPAVAAMIARQTQEVSHHLGISRGNVFPVSAQKGLLAKIKGDYALLERSGLPELELKLSGDLVHAKQQLLRDKVTREIGAVIETTSAMIEARLKAVQKQVGELKAMSGQNQETIQAMIQRMRQEKAAYDKTLASFQATRVVLNDQIKALLDCVSLEAFDGLTNKARQDMADAWTTHGLRIGMKTLFEGMIEAMEKANKQTQQIRGLVQAIYNKFHTDHGLAQIKPAVFSLLKERAELQKLYEEAEAYRNSPVMMMTEQHFVVKRFFITLVSRTRELFNACNAAARNWSKAIMAPILAQVREHKIMMDQRLENLKKVHENLDNLSTRISELETTRHNLENQLATIRAMQRKLATPIAEQVN
jgi:hypothetical protein